MLHRETLARNVAITTVEYIKQSEWLEWGRALAIIAELEVTAADVAAGDTLTCRLETSIDGVFWYPASPVITFAAVLGTTAIPYHESKSVTKDSSIGWFSLLRLRATPAGGTATFTFSVRLEAQCD